MDEWISLTEKTPENNTVIKVKNNRGKTADVNLFLCKNNEPYFSFPTGVRRFQPTHWMPHSDEEK